MPLVTLLVPFVDKTPADNDVVAGWGAFGLFLGLCVVVALLGWSLTRHLKVARANLYEEPEQAPDGHPVLSRDARQDAERSGEMGPERR